MITKRQITYRSSEAGDMITLTEEEPGSTYTMNANGVVTWEVEDPQRAKMTMDLIESMLRGANF